MDLVMARVWVPFSILESLKERVYALLVFASPSRMRVYALLVLEPLTKRVYAPSSCKPLENESMPFSHGASHEESLCPLVLRAPRE